MITEQNELFVDIEGIFEDPMKRVLTEVKWRIRGDGSPVYTYVYGDITRGDPSKLIAGPIKMLSDGVDERSITSVEIAKLLNATAMDYVMIRVEARYDAGS